MKFDAVAINYRKAMRDTGLATSRATTAATAARPPASTMSP
jgi:hypothetical protein